jgi:hypothetical protein
VSMTISTRCAHHTRAGTPLVYSAHDGVGLAGMKNVWRRESLMKSVQPFFAMTMMAIAGSTVAQAQTATADAQTPFPFELAQAVGPRGVGVEGVDPQRPRVVHHEYSVARRHVGASGTVTASAEGWVLGDVNPGGRGYFYVPVSSAGSAYRATVLSFGQGRRRGVPVHAPRPRILSEAH